VEKVVQRWIVEINTVSSAASLAFYDMKISESDGAETFDDVIEESLRMAIV
jgi:hypothetical protein